MKRKFLRTGKNSLAGGRVNLPIFPPISFPDEVGERQQNRKGQFNILLSVNYYSFPGAAGYFRNSVTFSSS